MSLYDHPSQFSAVDARPNNHDAFAPPQHGADEYWAYEIARPVIAVGVETKLAAMKETSLHHHRKAQLILTLSGLVTCEVDNSAWIVPPQCALWIPGGQAHSLKASGDLKIYCLFVDTDAAAVMPAECCTIAVTPLLRELMLRTASLPPLYDLDGPDGRLVTVLLDELAAAPIEKLHFPMPRDPRLRKIINAMLSDPAERLTIAEWGRQVGASERNLTRILRTETGMSFGRWRQQLHIQLALQHLAQGVSVKVVAQDLGYESASAFITMFRKALGKSPARYLADRCSLGSSAEALPSS
ncbi:helix-turn-helix transcriptional regulator [Nitrospirillum sp. BR 11163]|uniref:AraC family transcriptional regulator n=1 Tax=Nitrospirillum sp. BR 11163 TaxID=3104323 RepID=UPI002AFEAA36|nr:helix-turn-helix transcriptional regulator [Nitrospirillum sp. BR 11163]MEA1672879.1 helix-turn-helix transcriptional regulator [Nitrospirillum sp. BR 11163]